MNMSLFLIAAADTVLTVFFLLFLVSGKKFAPLVNAMEGFLAPLCGVGFRALELVRFNYRSQASMRKVRDFDALYGKKYGEFYYRANLAEQVTYGWLTLLAGLAVTILMETPALLLLAVFMAGGIVYYVRTTVGEKTKARRESISADYPELLSKLALLVNAGMIVSAAWEKTANTGTGTLYEEMRNAVIEIRNGTPEAEAYQNFAYRCNNEDVTKFISTLIQNLNKGNRELVSYLTEFSSEAWTAKKQRALQKGQEASSKLLIPLALIFIGIMTMICVPIFAGIGL